MPCWPPRTRVPAASCGPPAGRWKRSTRPGNGSRRCVWLKGIGVDDDALLQVLSRFQSEGVDYILVGGFAVRLNGFVRATEDIDLLLPSSIENGQKVIRALHFLPSSRELDPSWFLVDPEEPENIRVADEVVIDLLFAANGYSYASLQPHVRVVDVAGVPVRTLDLEGLLKTKQTGREKDTLDRAVLERLWKDVDGLERIRRENMRRVPPPRPSGVEEPASAPRLYPVASEAVARIGFDPDARLLVVEFTSSPQAYGYPNLSDEEIAGLVAVLENGESLGHFIATVVKPNHDHERVQF